MSPQRLKLVSNETLNDVSVVRRQDVLVLRLLDVIKKRGGTSPRPPKLVSNKTHNNVSVVHCQDVSMVSLYDVALERCNGVSKVAYHNVLSKSQLKNPMTLRGTSPPRL